MGQDATTQTDPIMKPPTESILDLEHRLKNIVHESSSVTVGSMIKEKAFILIPLVAIVIGSIATYFR
jgi:hypothetical protein